MAELDRIVEITLVRSSTPVDTASFQIPLLLATFTNFSERTRVYTDIDAVSDDFSTTSSVYVIASKLFGQTSFGAKPPSIIVGRRQVDLVTGSITVADNTVYTVTINGVPYSFTSGSSATATQIATGLDTAVGSPTGINFTATTGTFTASPTTPGANWSITASSNITLANTTATETWADALETVSDENDGWYALVAATHVPADVEALSDAVNARRKIYGTSTSNPATITTATTDIAAILNAKNADRTFVVYLPTADTEYPEAAWIGAQLAYTPGSNDWGMKQVQGVTRTVLNDTARVNLREKSANMYTRVAGVDIFQDGDTSGESPIDEIVFIDWLYARLQEGVYFRMINTLKVPMTNFGLAMIENEIRAVLSLAETNGGIDRGWRVTVPDILDIPENMRAQRIAGVFKFNARLQGSIRRVQILGYLGV